MKLTYAVWKLLPPDVQTTFQKIGTGADDASEFDNGEENAAGLKSALDKEKQEKAGIKTKLDGFETAKAAEIEAARKKAVEEARSTGDFASVEKDYQRQLKELRDENAKATKEAEERTKQDALNAAADDVAKMFTVPKAMKAFVSGRLAVDLVDGKAIVRVKDKDGNASGLSIEDLKKEYLTDKELKPSIAASRASGGGSGGATGGGGSGPVHDESKPFDAASADPKSMIARLEAKGGFDGDDD